MATNKYLRDFYLQDTFEVAFQLLGSTLYTHIDGKTTGGKIVEVEVYLGGSDKAAHSYQYKRTPRTEIHFGIGGHAYIFLIYGLYPQFCIVMREENVPELVFIRALEPTFGIEVMQERRKTTKLKELTSGPGKLCVALGITKKLYGADLCGDHIWVSPPENPTPKDQIIQAKRIGINYAEEYIHKLWRFYIKNNPFVSVKVPESRIIDNKEVSL